MPAPIASLFRLTTRDQAFPHWGPNFGLLQVVGGTPLVSSLADWDASPRPPPGTMLFVTRFTVTGTPQAAQSAIGLSVNIRNRITGALVAVVSTRGEVAVANPQTMIDTDTVDFALPLDRFYLEATATFSGGVANFLQFNWAGYVMPQGQIGFI